MKSITITFQPESWELFYLFLFLTPLVTASCISASSIYARPTLPPPVHRFLLTACNSLLVSSSRSVLLHSKPTLNIADYFKSQIWSFHASACVAQSTKPKLCSTADGALTQGVAHFPSTGPERKCFGFAGPYRLQLCCSSTKASVAYMYTNESGHISRRPRFQKVGSRSAQLAHLLHPIPQSLISCHSDPPPGLVQKRAPPPQSGLRSAPITLCGASGPLLILFLLPGMWFITFPSSDATVLVLQSPGWSPTDFPSRRFIYPLFVFPKHRSHSFLCAHNAWDILAVQYLQDDGVNELLNK